MNTQTVDAVKLKQAIKEFGSLQKAIDLLEQRKGELTTDVLAVTRDLDTKKKIKVDNANELNQLDDKINKRTEELEDILKRINKYSYQYRLFEGFISMLLTSPSKEEDLEQLADNILVWSKVIWG